MDGLRKILRKQPGPIHWPLQAKSVDELVGSPRQDISSDSLPVDKGSEFDSDLDQHEHECLPNSRVDPRDQVVSWVQSPKGMSMAWLDGMAGTGNVLSDQRRTGR
ncbi:unnamed protein product [Penicillium salamii]|uniref:Uncharacterized protein n=1 Tax=Penicillium salamii TaxID=1612424 RepID=A0A9W4NNS0_9EURO|nr:unnamed protein product [Penicillium salamii]CAG8282313.1 unnamed protein product [Penicillium salamii]CAG8384704.1 unnamed protein product [Penicillium salamii]CAG8388708.1 unnamed protein product [Penicillium salamii]CAG8391636.1 unnamed protein product [Penicillium salamii]